MFGLFLFKIKERTKKQSTTNPSRVCLLIPRLSCILPLLEEASFSFFSKIGFFLAKQKWAKDVKIIRLWYHRHLVLKYSTRLFFSFLSLSLDGVKHVMMGFIPLSLDVRRVYQNLEGKNSIARCQKSVPEFGRKFKVKKQNK